MVVHDFLATNLKASCFQELVTDIQVMVIPKLFDQDHDVQILDSECLVLGLVNTKREVGNEN